MNRDSFVCASSNASDFSDCKSLLLDDGNNSGRHDVLIQRDTTKLSAGKSSNNEECIAMFIASSNFDDSVDDSEEPLAMLSENEAVAIDEDDDDDETDSEDDEDHEDDHFNVDGLSMPKLSSSTIPIIVEVSNSYKSRGFYSSEDPLFQGICLYSSTKGDSNNQEGVSKSLYGITNNMIPTDIPGEQPIVVVDEKNQPCHAVTEGESNSWYTRVALSMIQFLRLQ
jgi:hypothetical protein